MVELVRTYHKHYTEGLLTLPDGSELKVLELPWRDNDTNVSCIPEGVYTIDRDESGTHTFYAFRNEETEPRTFIEFHPANRLSQLAGCLAPCMAIKGSGREVVGVDSLKACQALIEWFGDDSWRLKITS